MPFWGWSRTTNSNATADPTINWQEGQPPSSINDSARAMMTRLAEYRDDMAGANVTGGSASNYTLTTAQGFDSKAHMNGMAIAFTPHVTNTGAQAFINVDGLGLTTLRLGTGLDVPAGTLVAGTPYQARYNNSDGVWYLQGFYNTPYLIPIGATLEFWGSTAPNSSFVFPAGQAISRTVYSSLFALVGTAFGAGDGSTTFNLPDLRGRVTACVDNMGGSDAGRLAGTNSALAGVRFSMGGAGGESSHALSAGEIPTLTSTGSNGITVAASGGQGIPVTASAISTGIANGTSGTFATPASSGGAGSWTSVTSLSGSNNISVTTQGTGSGPHNIMQPTILCNRIMRII